MFILTTSSEIAKKTKGKLEGANGLTLHFNNAETNMMFISIRDSKGNLRSPEDVGKTAVHEGLHTVGMRHPFDMNDSQLMTFKKLMNTALFPYTPNGLEIANDINIQEGISAFESILDNVMTSPAGLYSHLRILKERGVIKTIPSIYEKMILNAHDAGGGVSIVPEQFQQIDKNVKK